METVTQHRRTMKMAARRLHANAVTITAATEAAILYAVAGMHMRPSIVGLRRSVDDRIAWYRTDRNNSNGQSRWAPVEAATRISLHAGAEAYRAI